MLLPRRLRTAALLPVAAITLAGCQWTSPVQTDHAYEPAEGRSVHMDGLTVSNALVVAEKQGAAGTLVGRISNDTDRPATVTLRVGEAKPVEVQVPAHDSKQLSTKQTPTAVTAVPVPPGALIDMAINTDRGDAQSLRIPVLAPYPPYGDFRTGGALTPAPEPTHTAGGEGH